MGAFGAGGEGCGTERGDVDNWERLEVSPPENCFVLLADVVLDGPQGGFCVTGVSDVV